MKGIIQTQPPDETGITLTIHTNLGELRRLQEVMPNEYVWPMQDFRDIITEAIKKCYPELDFNLPTNPESK